MYCRDSKAISQEVKKCTIPEKVFALAFQKHQNHFHRCCGLKARESKVRKLLRCMRLCIRPGSFYIFLRNCLRSGVGVVSGVKFLHHTYSLRGGGGGVGVQTILRGRHMSQNK